MVQWLGIFFCSLKFLCEIFYPHQIQWPNPSQPAWRNIFYLFFQCSLLVLPFKLTAGKQKSLSGLLTEAWPKYSFEHRAMNPHAKNPWESSPCDSWLGQRQREHAASSFPWEKCHLQILPIITAENQAMAFMPLPVINQSCKLPSKAPTFKVSCCEGDSASSESIKESVPRQGLQNSSARVWFPAHPSPEWHLSAQCEKVKYPTNLGG